MGGWWWGAPEGSSGIQQTDDLDAALSDSPPLIELLRFHQGVGLIVQLIQLKEKSLHVQRSLWAAEWRAVRLR